ncbi:hypothetical protein M2480_001322 [Parabacteroides sp. PFB2-12]|nr:hypothetical protein [Parabacteroides sp. PM6-13]MDH6390349.1 hypothetical protein [Parabacteroides sp. PFB2-12]
MARNTYKPKTYYPGVAKAIAREYIALHRKYCYGCARIGSYCGRSMEDVFADTVFYVMHDEVAKSLPTDQLLQHFDYRYNMLLYRARMDARRESHPDSIEPKPIDDG